MNRFIEFVFLASVLVFVAPVKLVRAEETNAPSAATAQRIEKAIDNLSSESWKVRRAACLALWEEGGDAVAALEKTAAGADAHRAFEARRILFLIRWRISPDVSSRILPLWEGFDALPPRERMLRILAVGACGMDETVALLKRAAQIDPDPAVRKAAALAAVDALRTPEFLTKLDALNGEGCELMRTGEYARAEEKFNRMLELDPGNYIALYNLACSRSLQNDVEEALRLLAESIENGYREFTHIREDPDLDNLRKDPRFLLLLAGKWKRK